MSGGGGGSRGNECPAMEISAAARNMVLSLKEIVNLPDQEIYAALKECAMDPSEAVQRLLSQDTFHEVKRKRDKKKEMKDFPDSRTTTVNNCEVFGVYDRVSLVSSIQSTSTGSGECHGGPAHKRENGMPAVTSLSNVGYGSDHSRTSAVICETASIEKPVQATGIADGSSLHSETLSGYQHGWAGKPNVSLADIVKMGRPQDKLSGASIGAENSCDAPQNQITSNLSQHGFKQFGNPVLPSELDRGVRSSKGSHEEIVISYEEGNSSNKPIPYDGWSFVDNLSTASNIPIIETSGAATSYVTPSQSAVDVDGQFLEDSQDAEIPRLEQNAYYEGLPEQTLRFAYVYDTPIFVGDSEGSSSVDDDGSLDSIMGAHQFEKHALERQEVEDVNINILSDTANLKELSLKKSELLAPSVEDNPAVIIPRHLQVSNADFSHLSFGSFGTSSSGSFQERPLQSNSEVMKIAEVPSFEHSDGRNSNYNENDHLKSPINDGVVSRGSITAMNYYMPSNSEPEVIRDDARDAASELQYNFPSISDYGTSTSTEHSLLAFAHPQTNSQTQNLAHLSKIMVKPSAFSSTQPTLQSLPSTSAPAVPSLPQDLPSHAFSQANLPLGPFSDTTSNYTFLPQSHAYLPSAFPEAFTGADLFHQSPASVHNTALNFAPSQYRNSISTASIPQSAVLASGYRDFGRPTSIPGNFSLNSSTTSTSTSTGFDDDLSSLYKERTHYLRHLQQNQSTPMRRRLPGGGGSRTVSPLPPSTFYGFQGQNQQPSHYELARYLNLYQNQLSGYTQEHQQSRIEANLNGSQRNPSLQSHHTWPHGY